MKAWHWLLVAVLVFVVIVILSVATN